jgi:hypothetical protein
MRQTILVAFSVMIAVAFSCESPAAILYSTAGSTYSQNFNSLPATPENASLGSTPAGWTDDNAAPAAGNYSIVGWYLFHPTAATEGGFNGHQRLRIGPGNSTTGAFMSWGSTGSADRSLGMLNSSTLGADGSKAYYGARFTNNTGTTLNSFTLGYTGEQWHEENTVAQSITFDYSLSALSIDDITASFTAVPSLDFTSPTFVTATSTPLDGNAAANRTVISPITVTGLNWLPGTDLWIRWTDTQEVNRDHGLGLDDLSFSANATVVPEPTTCALLCLAIFGLFTVRRTR